MQCADCRELLGGHIDGELMMNESQDVQAHLADCAECAREHEALAATSQLLKKTLVRHPAPDVLKARIRSALAQPDAFEPAAPKRPKYSQWIRLAAACAAVAVISSGVTYQALTRGGGPRGVAEEIITSHVRSLMAGHLTDVESNNTHNVKPWFNGKVDLSPTVPRLDSIGFPLLGGRIDYVQGRAVATVVYTRRQHVINVYSWPRRGPNTDPVAAGSDKGYHLIEWRRDGIEQWAVSDLNTAELADFARAFTASR
jgi:anti-sigma factor RsiW